MANLLESLAGNFAGVIQYNKDNRKTSAGWNITLDTLCDIMVNESIGTPVNRSAFFLHLYQDQDIYQHLRFDGNGI